MPSKKNKRRTASKKRLPHFQSIHEEHVYKAQNGKVLVNDWLRKTIDDKKMKIQGNVRHKRINMTRKVKPKVMRQMPMQYMIL